MSVDRVDSIVPRPGPAGVPVACGACLPHNIALQVSGMHRAPGGFYFHLVCSKGHRQRLGLRAIGGRVLLEMSLSVQSASPKPGDIVH
jgi:hypothetical protein